jgi:hypothetical protein
MSYLTLENHCDNFKSEISEIAQKMFNEQGELQPVLFALVYKKGKFGIAILGGLEKFFSSDDDKETAAIMMKKFNQEAKPIATAFASEGWMSTFNKDTEIHDEDGNYKEGIVRPSKDPKRKEVITINFETYNKKAFSCWEIERKGEEATLVETTFGLDWEDKDSKFSGRFSGLLEENYSYVAELMKEINFN